VNRKKASVSLAFLFLAKRTVAKMPIQRAFFWMIEK